MKFLITNKFPPWKIGGVQKVILEYSKILAKNHEIKIICNGKENNKNFFNDLNVEQIKSSYLPINYYLIKAIKENSKSFDLIHTHNFSNTIPYHTYLSIKNKPFIVSAHYHPRASNVYFGFAKRFYDPIINSKILQKADIIICVSDFEKKTLMKKFKIKRNKIKVIYNGIDINKIRDFKPYDLDFKTILFVGRLEQYKNVQYIIRSMKYLEDNVKLIIIGEGDFKQRLIEITKTEGLTNKVKFLGRVEDDELYKWINTADLLVNLSSIEAFGITVLEALAAGKRAVVNDQMGLKELASLFKNVEPINIDNLSIKEIAQIIQINMGKKFAEDMLLNKFDWNYLSKKYENLYLNVIENWNSKY